MKKLFNNYFFNLGLIIVIGIIVYAISYGAFGQDMIIALKQAKIEYLLLTLVIVFLWQFLIGYVLTKLTRFTYPEYKIKDGILNAFVAALFHGITPSSTGGQFAQFYVYRKQGVSTGDAGSILWMEFIIYQSCLTLISLVLIILKFGYFYKEFSNLFIFVIIGFIINTSIIFFLYALAKFKRLHTWLTTKGVNLAYRFHIIKDKENTIINVENQLERFRYEIANLKHNKKAIASCVIICIIRLLLYYSIPFFVFLSLGTKFDLNLLLDSIAMGSFVAIASGMIPIPGASGGTEAIFILMFSNLFGSATVAGAMILWRFMTYYLVMILGAISFAMVKLKRVD